MAGVKAQRRAAQRLAIRNDEFVQAGRRLRRRPENMTAALKRAEKNAGADGAVSSAAERLRLRPEGFTSALNRVKRNAEANRRRIR